MNSKSNISTENASRYLQQLCKHFGHKLPADFNATHGSITLLMGKCELEATEGALELRASASDGQDLDRLEGVIASHLERFAFREELQIDWAQPADAQAS